MTGPHYLCIIQKDVVYLDSQIGHMDRDMENSGVDRMNIPISYPDHQGHRGKARLLRFKVLTGQNPHRKHPEQQGNNP